VLIDPILALAHSIHSNKGVFALLLGSGISRSAGIPTGWEVTLDLVRRIAKLEGEEITGDPAEWFLDKHGTQPEYSALLASLTKTAPERRALLHSLFEPTEEEREQGLKLPTRAHRSIAKLVAKGYVRVIVTTNFDRLLEAALQDEGIVPSVISSPDALHGAAPLIHQRCVILKVHGDYLDDRILNTEEELSAYDAGQDKYLDRIFDEFGLVVCGWSGDWDPALRAAIERCPSRRYTTFWASVGAASERAEKLIVHRGAVIAGIRSADEFFEKLEEKISSLEELDAPSPLSVASAISTVKRFASDPGHRIRLNDLLLSEAQSVKGKVMGAPVAGVEVNEAYLRHRFQMIDSQTEILRGVLRTASFWAEPYHQDSIKRCIQTLFPGGPASGNTYLLDLRWYPAIIAFNSAALGALEGGQFQLLSRLGALVLGSGRSEKLGLPDLTTSGMDRGLASFSEVTNWYFPLSEHFRRHLFGEPGETAFEEGSAFDRLEVMFALMYLDRHPDPAISSWMPLGRFAARHASSAYQDVFADFEREGANWPPVLAGMFSGSAERVRQLILQFKEIVQKSGVHFRF
jgi:hypothetical protein